MRLVALFAVALSLALMLLYGLTRGDWLAGVLGGLTLAMAILPEEFPVVLTVFLALGAWRISQHRVLTRRMPAIEMLGAATVLCVDKTGTLTENRMAVVDTPQAGGGIAALACEVDLFDPMEKAIVAGGARTPLRARESWRLEPTIPSATISSRCATPGVRRKRVARQRSRRAGNRPCAVRTDGRDRGGRRRRARACGCSRG